MSFNVSRMPEHIDINELVVLHRLRGSDGAGLPGRTYAQLAGSGLALDTCLRQLVIPADAVNGPTRADATDAGMEIHLGGRAYAFLLETATGLRSAVPGETNIQGQFRRAWQEYAARTDGAASERLRPVMRQLFQDAAIIRRNHLQGIGGDSYGSLVRKLLRPTPSERILFAGTGDLFHSLLPMFHNFSLGMWNHHELFDIPNFITSLFVPDAADDAARWATQLVMTTPADSCNDGRWHTLSREHGILTVVHLGRRRENPGPWVNHAGFLCLDDVFDLRRTQSNVRMLQLTLARRRCGELAAERSSAPEYRVQSRRALA